MAEKYKPDWVKKLEDLGDELEKKYDSSSRHPEPGEGTRTGDLDSSCGQNDDECKRPEWQHYSPFGDLFGQFISYLVITYAPIYFPGFFTTGWSAVFIVLIYVILLNVVVDVFQIFVKARPIYYLGKVITNAASVVSMVVLVTIFPFNFPGNIGVIVQFGLWIAIVVVSVVTFFEFFKIFSSNKG